MAPIPVSRTAYTDKGFFLSWQSNVNSTGSYVVDWHDASCSYNCPVEWIKVATGSTNVSIESGITDISDMFFFFYSCLHK